MERLIVDARHLFQNSISCKSLIGFASVYLQVLQMLCRSSCNVHTPVELRWIERHEVRLAAFPSVQVALMIQHMKEKHI